MLPRGLDPWRDAAARLPLGRNEKLFLEIIGDSSFDPETRVLGNPRDRATGVYFIRPFGSPVIECFLGDQGARMVEEMGPAAGFAHAINQLAALFGSAVSRSLRPRVASSWSGMTYVGEPTAMRFLGMLRHGQIWPILSSSASSSPARRRTSTTIRPRMAPMTAAFALRRKRSQP